MKYTIIDMMSAKRYIFASVLCLLGLFLLSGAGSPAAQDNGAAGVKIRAARHADLVRIVVTAEGFTFSKSSAILNKNRAIVIDMRQDVASADRGRRSFTARTGKGALKEGVSVEILKSVSLTLNGMELAITTPNIRDIKTSRLQSPSRIVIDVSFTSAPQDDSGQTGALKPLADQLALRTFVIDAGHGGYEYGIRGARFAEKDFTLSFARDLAAVLAKSGRNALLVRKADLVMTLNERIAISNKKGPDIFISFHVSSTKAASVYVVPDRAEERSKVFGRGKKDVSWNVADSIAKNIEKEFSIKAVKTELPLPLLTMTKAPAVIIELPNPDEFSYDKKNRERMLSAIIRGLAAGTRDERQAAPVNKPDAGSEKKTAVKAVKPAPKPDTDAVTERKAALRPARQSPASDTKTGSVSGKKAETKVETGAEKKSRVTPKETPKGEN
jgi:N-acetylmuramoyl-L-alanine amidase